MLKVKDRVVIVTSNPNYNNVSGVIESVDDNYDLCEFPYRVRYDKPIFYNPYGFYKHDELTLIVEQCL